MEQPIDKVMGPKLHFGIPRMIDYAYTLFLTGINVAMMGPKSLVFSVDCVNTSEGPMSFLLLDFRVKHRSAGVPILLPKKDFRVQKGILGRGMNATVEHPPIEVELREGVNHFKFDVAMSYGHPEAPHSRKVDFSVDVAVEARKPPMQNAMRFSIEKHMDAQLTEAGAERLTKSEGQQNQS